MKELLILAITCFSVMGINAQKFTLEANVRGIGDDTVILYHWGEQVGEPVKVKNDRFTLKQESLKTDNYVMKFVNNNYYLPIELEEGELKLEASVDYERGGYILDFVVIGSETYDLIHEFAGLYTKMVKNNWPKENADKYLESLLLNKDRRLGGRADQLWSDLQNAHPEMESEFNVIAAKWMIEHVDKYAVINVFGSMVHKISIELQSEILSALPDKWFEYPQMQGYKDAADALKNTSAGGTAPDFTLESINGKSYTLSDYHGQYVLLDFWASWCGPCKKAIPHLRELQEEYKDLVVMSISADENLNNWRKASKELDISWINLIHDKAQKGDDCVIKRYQANSLPTIILVDKQGKVLLKTHLPEDLDAKLADIFGK